MPRLGEGDVLEFVNAVRGGRPGTPLLLITSPERRNAANLAALRVDEVVWLDELTERLPATLRQYRESLARFRLAGTLESHPRLSAPLRKALAAAIRSDFPPRRVAGLVRLGERSMKTFKLHWKRDIFSVTGLSRRRLLRLLLLLRAVELRGASDPWSHVAAELGVELSYLEKIATLEFGEPLGRLGDITVERIVELILAGIGIESSGE